MRGQSDKLFDLLAWSGMVWFNDHLSSNCKHACLEIESFPWHDDSRNRHLQLVLLDKGCLMSTIFKAFQRVKGKVHETCFLACLKNPRGCWQVTMEGVSTWMYSVRDEAKRGRSCSFDHLICGIKKAASRNLAIKKPSSSCWRQSMAKRTSSPVKKSCKPWSI